MHNACPLCLRNTVTRGEGGEVEEPGDESENLGRGMGDGAGLVGHCSGFDFYPKEGGKLLVAS